MWDAGVSKKISEDHVCGETVNYDVCKAAVRDFSGVVEVERWHTTRNLWDYSTRKSCLLPGPWSRT